MTKTTTMTMIECRHVTLPPDLAKLVPRNHLMTETEWRNLGIIRWGKNLWGCVMCIQWLKILMEFCIHKKQ